MSGDGSLPNFFTQNTGRTVFEGLGGLTLDGASSTAPPGMPGTAKTAVDTSDSDGIDFSQLTAEFMASKPLDMSQLTMPMPAGAVPLSFDTGAMVGAATGSGTGPNQATRLPVPNPSRPELLPHEAQMYRDALAYAMRMGLPAPKYSDVVPRLAAGETAGPGPGAPPGMRAPPGMGGVMMQHPQGNMMPPPAMMGQHGMMGPGAMMMPPHGLGMSGMPGMPPGMMMPGMPPLPPMSPQQLNQMMAQQQAQMQAQAQAMQQHHQQMQMQAQQQMQHLQQQQPAPSAGGATAGNADAAAKAQVAQETQTRLAQQTKANIDAQMAKIQAEQAAAAASQALPPAKTAAWGSNNVPLVIRQDASLEGFHAVPAKAAKADAEKPKPAAATAMVTSKNSNKPRSNSAVSTGSAGASAGAAADLPSTHRHPFRDGGRDMRTPQQAPREHAHGHAAHAAHGQGQGQGQGQGGPGSFGNSPMGPGRNGRDRTGSRFDTPRYPTGTLMPGSDVRFVVNKVLQPLQTENGFEDDFYFLQTQIKKSNRDAEEAEARGEEAPDAPHIPRPAWKDTKHKIRAQMTLSRQAGQDRSREWMADGMVLGHLPKSNVHRPKELLAVPTAALDGTESPFGSLFWTMRQSVQKGCEALYTVQELQFLLRDPAIQYDHRVRMDIEGEVVEAVALLSAAIGIQDASTASPSNDAADGAGIHLDDRLVAAILQTPKGRKLMSRSIKLLVPEHRWVLVPAILAKLLQAQASVAVAEDARVETRLLKTILSFIAQSRKDQSFMVKEQLPDATQFSSWLLASLRKCLELVVATTATPTSAGGAGTPGKKAATKVSLKDSVLSSRTRAEVFNAIIEAGEATKTAASAAEAKDWLLVQDRFSALLEA